MISVVVHPQAEAELKVAAAFYEEQLAGLGIQLLEESIVASEEYKLLRNRSRTPTKDFVEYSRDGFLTAYFTKSYQTAFQFWPLHIRSSVPATGDAARRSLVC